MKKLLLPGFSLLFLMAVLSFLSVSCNSSGSGGGDDEAEVKYKVELEEGQLECLIRLRWMDEEGDIHYDYEIDENPWRRYIYPRDGAELYLYVEIECDRVKISITINGDIAELKARDGPDTVVIDGYLYIDEDGNATFEEKD